MKKINTLADLIEAASQKRSVVSEGMGPCKNPKPAAFVISMQGRCIHNLIVRGLYVYEKGQASKRPWKESYGEFRKKGDF